jgi:cyanophycin synthetase
MADLALRLECSGRRVCVLSAPGDRRDEDIRAIARIAGKAFDHIILKRDDDLRGRGPEEIPRMMEEELLASGFPRAQLELIPDEQAAINAALAAGQRGDLLLLFADKISRSWKQVIYFKPSDDAPGPAAVAPAAARSAPGIASGAQPAEASEVILDGALVIEDERGVRLARERDD